MHKLFNYAFQLNLGMQCGNYFAWIVRVMGIIVEASTSHKSLISLWLIRMHIYA